MCWFLFYIGMDFELFIIWLRVEVLWLFLDFVYFFKKYFIKLKILFFEKFCLFIENLKLKLFYKKFRVCLMGSLCIFN